MFETLFGRDALITLHARQKFLPFLQTERQAPCQDVILWQIHLSKAGWVLLVLEAGFQNFHWSREGLSVSLRIFTLVRLLR